MSETKTVVTHQKVTDMLMKMLSLGGHLIVDINKQVHYSLSPTEPIYLTVKGDKTPKTLYIYDTNITDPNAIIINPLAETASVGVERLMFYSTLAYVQAQWIWKILQFVVDESIAHKKDDKETNPDLISILAPFIDQVDEKMLLELDHIKGVGIKDFCNIYYNRVKKTSTMLFGLEDESGDYFKSFPTGKVRKKSWTVFTNIIRFILKVADGKQIKEEYTCTTDKVDCPHFTTFSTVWLKAWEAMTPYMQWFEGTHEEQEIVEALTEHFKYIPVYRECVVWLKQPTAAGPESKFVVPSTGSQPDTQVQVASSEQQVQTQKVPSWQLQSQEQPAVVTVQPQKVPSWMPQQTGYGYAPQPQPTYSPRQSFGNIVTVSRRMW